MMHALIRAAVRLRFTAMTRGAADRQIQSALVQYRILAERIDAPEGARSVRVPTMPGVDREMREWSFFMILEHNAIVNNSISGIVQALARDAPPPLVENFDPKKDVLPSPDPGEEQLGKFRRSVEAHAAAAAELGRLRGTRTHPHPIFGIFDAHRWHCMFGFHLMLHARQAARVVDRLCADRGEPLRGGLSL